MLAKRWRPTGAAKTNAGERMEQGKGRERVKWEGDGLKHGVWDKPRLETGSMAAHAKF